MAYPRHVGPPVYDPRGFYGHLDPEAPAPVVRVKRKSRSRSLVRRWVAVVVGGIVAIAVRSFVAGMDDPAVGDCVNTAVSTGFAVVGCDSAEAQFRIVGQEEGFLTEAEFQAATGLCSGFPASVIYLWEPGSHRTSGGKVYCAAQI